MTYFKNRDSTGDLDYMIDPEWVDDGDIKTPLMGHQQLAKAFLDRLINRI